MNAAPTLQARVDRIIDATARLQMLQFQHEQSELTTLATVAIQTVATEAQALLQDARRIDADVAAARVIDDALAAPGVALARLGLYDAIMRRIAAAFAGGFRARKNADAQWIFDTCDGLLRETSQPEAYAAWQAWSRRQHQEPRQ